MSNQQAVVRLLSAKLGSLAAMLENTDSDAAQLEILDRYMPALSAANREMDVLLDELGQLHEEEAK